MEKLCITIGDFTEFSTNSLFLFASSYILLYGKLYLKRVQM